MTSQILFTQKETRRELGNISRYRLNRLIADGVMPKPISRGGQRDVWHESHIKAAIRRLDALAHPTPTPATKTTTRPLCAKHCAEIATSRGL